MHYCNMHELNEVEPEKDELNEVEAEDEPQCSSCAGWKLRHVQLLHRRVQDTKSHGQRLRLYYLVSAGSACLQMV